LNDINNPYLRERNHEPTNICASFKMARQGNHDGERLTRLEQGVEEMVRSIWMLIELVRGMQVNDPTPEIQKTTHL
jgi:hypothetical protein